MFGRGRKPMLALELRPPEHVRLSLSYRSPARPRTYCVENDNLEVLILRWQLLGNRCTPNAQLTPPRFPIAALLCLLLECRLQETFAQCSSGRPAGHSSDISAAGGGQPMEPGLLRPAPADPFLGLAMANSLLNPIIYTFTNRDLRHALLRLLCCGRGPCNQDSSNSLQRSPSAAGPSGGGLRRCLPPTLDRSSSPSEHLSPQQDGVDTSCSTGSPGVATANRSLVPTATD